MFLLRFLVMLMVMAMPVLLSAKGHNPRTLEKTISYSLGGSTTVDKIMQLAIEEYLIINPTLQLAYEGVGSSNGVKNVLNGTYILGGSSRNLKDSEMRAGAKWLVVAYDGIVLVLNNSVSIQDLDLETVAAIFSGKISRWKQINPALEGAITVVNREAGSGTHASFRELVMNGANFSDKSLIAISNGDVASKIASTKGSIGYIGLGYLDQINGRGHVITIAGQEANADNISQGKYAIARPLYLVYLDNLDGFKKQFSDFLLSEVGQKAVIESGFIQVS